MRLAGIRRQWHVGITMGMVPSVHGINPVALVVVVGAVGDHAALDSCAVARRDAIVSA